MCQAIPWYNTTKLSYLTMDDAIRSFGTKTGQELVNVVWECRLRDCQKQKLSRNAFQDAQKRNSDSVDRPVDDSARNVLRIQIVCWAERKAIERVSYGMWLNERYKVSKSSRDGINIPPWHDDTMTTTHMCCEGRWRCARDKLLLRSMTGNWKV